MGRRPNRFWNEVALVCGLHGLDCEGHRDLIWHYWIGDVTTHSREEGILCTSAEGLTFIEDEIINVTTLKDKVTCEKCLEWLHA